MVFYLASVDEDIADDNDNPSIGIILCKYKSKTVKDRSVQYITKPIGVAGYTLTKELPDEIKVIQKWKTCLNKSDTAFFVIG